MSMGALVTPIRLPNLGKEAKTAWDDILRLSYGVPLFNQLRDAALPHKASANGATPTIECVDDVEERVTEYLSHLRLPFGMLSGLQGFPGVGKTFGGLDVAAKGSRGIDALTGAKIEPFSSLIMSNENPPSEIRKRLRAMGADMKRVFILRGSTNSDGSERGITLADISLIREAITKTGAKFFIIDPIQSYMGAKVDSHKANETRPLMDGLAKLAEELHIVILILQHLSKGGGGRAGTRGLGSIDIIGAMRSVLMMGTASDDAKNCALVHVKSNVGPLAPSLAFVIQGKDDNAKIVWKGTSSLTAGDLVAPDGPRRATQVDDAENYLLEKLASGPKSAKELEKEGAFSKAALHRASRRVGVVKTRQGESGPWVWSLRNQKFARPREARDE